VQLVISDAHEGLRRSALSQVFTGATWQRCKVHFLRNMASAVPKLHAPAVLAVVKSIFLQPTRETGRRTKRPWSSWISMTHRRQVVGRGLPSLRSGRHRSR
jgi:putative transposase